jgi:hypothetical protein
VRWEDSSDDFLTFPVNEFAKVLKIGFVIGSIRMDRLVGRFRNARDKVSGRRRKQ